MSSAQVPPAPTTVTVASSVADPLTDRLDAMASGVIGNALPSVSANGLRRGSLGVQSNLLRSVIKIFAVRTEPNLSMPWQMKRQYSTTASGFAVADKRIVTNAHAVAFQTSIRVRKHGCAEKFVARVIGVCHQSDLAVLTVEDESFWRDVDVLEFGDIPDLQESITVIGYPTGGDSISVTKGVVSRIEETYYSHGNFRLLAIQIDAAINPGNSGGPALSVDMKVVGVCFETLLNAENIGYIIPIPVVKHFLEDVERNKGACSGFCDIGIQIQLMESDHIRKAMGMSAEQTGILVNKVYPLSDAMNVLQKDDVILSISGSPIGNDGTIPFRDGGERVSFRYAILHLFDGDTVSMQILRNREILDITVKVMKPGMLAAIPANQYDVIPSYFIFAGMVFQVLTQPYLSSEWGKEWQQKAPVRFVEKALYAAKDKPDQEVVIVSQILAADINVTYQQYVPNIVTHVNNVPINNLRHLVELVESNRLPFLRLDLESERVIVLDAQMAASDNAEILESHNIPYIKSADLRRHSATSPLPTRSLADLHL
jgi:S1-C subfamily serine protease